MCERYYVDRVSLYDNSERNTNNHMPGDDVKHLDYYTELNRTRLCNYIHLIDYPVSHTYTFSEKEHKILLTVSENGRKIGKPSSLFKEDLDPIIERLKLEWLEGMWFFRFDSNSPKDGYGEYPVFNPKQVINMIETSDRAYKALKRSDRTLYFVKYEMDWDIAREFRVFIYQRRVTAISQYSTYNEGILSRCNDTDVINISKKLCQQLENTVNRVCDHIGTDNIVADVYLKPDGIIKIIEFNSFGYWLAAGSALFHWLNDKNKLYNTEGNVYIRIISANE